jgi:hypothetical protein
MSASKKHTTHQHISQLWQGLREVIDRAYESHPVEEEKNALRDYAKDQSWSDDLEKLLASETANERQHRNARSVRGFSSQDAAKLIICNNVLRGSELEQIPSALTFISFRASAAEANLLGYLIRGFVTPEWKASVESLDYADCMKTASV